MLKLIIFIIAAVSFAYYANQSFQDTFGEPAGEPVACTMDAKLCPDGSSVGRVGPDCSFAACPGE